MLMRRLFCFGVSQTYLQNFRCSKNISIPTVFTTATQEKLLPKWMENGTWLHWMSKTSSGNRSAVGCTTHRLRLSLEL
jgi:hypothetical protein